MINKFYQLSAPSLQGEEITMETYKGKIIVVVNTASLCGFTPQFDGLEKLYTKYKDQGLVILGFPCNQFGKQEPGDEQSIAEGCVVNYGVTLPMFSKVDVNGNHAHLIFKNLREELGGLMGDKVKWNFTKFLIDSSGNPVKRFAPVTSPEKMEKYIKNLLPN